MPALGRPELTGFHAHAVALLARERRERADYLELVAPAPGNTILDVGCGTGNFALMLEQHCLDARVIGVALNPAVLKIAQLKSERAGVTIE